MNWLKKYWEILRRLRPLHIAHNIKNYRKLRSNKKLYKQYGVSKSVVSGISHKDLSGKKGELPWLDTDNALEKMQNDLRFGQFSEEVKQTLLQWPEKGYLILKNHVDADLIDQANAQLEELIKSGEIEYDYTNTRVMNSYRKSEAAKKIITDKKTSNILDFILNRTTIPFQSINFINGSQQKTHSDFIHMTTHPPGYLIAIWVAMEDLDSGSGLLHYYPGSHKLPYVMGDDFEHSSNKIIIGKDLYGNYEKKIAELIKERGLQKEIFQAKKGDMLVWHANLLHGGEPRTNPNATRKSLVAHYFCEGDIINYHEITQRPAVIERV